jgi:hypothetical protein
VSQTNDPAGTWFAYEYDMGSQFADYPKFGVWPDAYYMSANKYGSSGFNGTLMVAFDRKNMLAGSPTPRAPIGRTPTYLGNRFNVFGTLPADLDGPSRPPSGARNSFAMAWDPGGTGTDKIVLFGFHVDWVNRANSNVNTTSIASAHFDQNLCSFGGNFACLPEPAPGERLDSLAGEMMYRNVYRVTGGVQRILLNFTVNVGSGRAGIRWYELTRPGTAWGIRQQSTYAPAGPNRWMGSIAQDKLADIALGYSAGSSTLMPAVRYTGRLDADPLSTLPQGEAVMQAGGGVQQNGFNRWGDYSDMSIDPANDCTFWYTNEYYATTTGQPTWSTVIGRFKFPSCT